MDNALTRASPSAAWSDRARQVAVVLTAIAQPAASAFVGSAVGTTARDNPSAILPAGYAFAIWGPVFLLLLVSAVAVLAPSLTRDAALRRSGWFIAVACAANTAWVLVFAAELFVLAQIVIVIGAVAAILASVAVQRTATGGPAVRLLIAPSYGLLAGWVTAACFVGFAATLSSTGIAGSGPGARFSGFVLLAAIAATAALVLRAGAAGPPLGFLAYPAAVAWAATGIAVEQWAAHRPVALTAIALAALLVVAAVALGVRAFRSTGRRA